MLGPSRRRMRSLRVSVESVDALLALLRSVEHGFHDFFGSGIATWTTDAVEIYFRDDPWQISEPASPYQDQERISESSEAS